jgi:hypothetical protein
MTSTSLQPAALLLVFLGGLSGCAHMPVAAAPATSATPSMLVTGSRIPRLGACRSNGSAGWRGRGILPAVRRPGASLARPGRYAATPALCSFSRLCVRQISDHSARALSMPRRRNWRRPRACLIWPKTGSTVVLRLA